MSHENLDPEPPAPGKSAPEPAEGRPRFQLSRREWAVFVVVLLFYAATRLYGIVDFPIYFFCDEAQQANLAQNLVDNGFRDDDGNLCPAYFRNVRVFNLGLSVWVHALPIAAFGKTIFTVRTTSVMVGLFGTAALMLALKWFFGVRLWWTGGLVMAALPAWFLHSRTAFETAMMVGFYAMFVLSYLLYREVSAWWLSAAIVCGAATFYSYSNGQGVMFVSCLLLLIVDWRYHWRVVRRHPAAAATAVVVVLLVAAPYVRFRFFLHPEMMATHLDDLNSYWIEEIPLDRKIEIFATTYLRGLSPSYWFTEDTTELVRHRMFGRPYLPLWLAPAILIGLVVSCTRWRRSPAHRLVLIAVLAAPFSASLVGLRITRVLAMMVPATLAATVGLEWLRVRLERRFSNFVLAASLALGLAAASVVMTRDALVDGPRWFSNYGMHGLQWGAKELFAAVKEYLETTPGDHRIVISHTWANNANSFAAFFLDDDEQQRISWGTIQDVLESRNPLVEPTTRFVLTAEEFEQARESPKLLIDPSYEIIPDPSGRPAFVIARLAYTADADSLFLAEMRERRQLVESVVVIDGCKIEVRHPKLDMGQISDAFDGDLESLARTLDANPANIDIRFPTARAVRGVRLHLWTDHYQIRLRAIRADGGELAEVVRDAVSGRPPEPIEVLFDDRVPDVIELELSIAKQGDVHVHLREIEILE
jgi:4-amino-4-deoxy-L-arabinose transferase-like glycosyltransferase